MPLYDHSYQRYEGPRTSPLARIWALARYRIGSLLKRRGFIILLGLCWMPAIVRGAMIYIHRQFPQTAEVIDVSPAFWQEFLVQQVQYFPILFVALYTGAAAIALDVRSGALTIYLSRPFSPLDYLIAKALPVIGAVTFITLIPAFVLLALHVSIAGDWSLLREAPLLPVSILAYSSLVALYFGLTVLAVSSLCRSRLIAGAGFVALMLGSHFFYGALGWLSFDRPPVVLSLLGSASDAAHLFFFTPDSGDSPIASFVAMLLVMVIAFIVIRRRLSAVEVTS